ncbi:protein of unknown function [Agrobacterium pusense]|uniref:Uncharacterized protein n=1 Tax=Agrobacterium pusense TaxID=648995 RepID=U4QD29_9HYPH|nr:protein of unknown function [Agrobacterium pusense]
MLTTTANPERFCHYRQQRSKSTNPRNDLSISIKQERANSLRNISPPSGTEHTPHFWP